MASGMSEEELMEQIAERIAKNQISFDSKSKDEKKSLTPKIQIVAESQLTEIKKTFNSMLGESTEVIPAEVRTMVLERIYDKVASQGIKSIDAAFSSPEMIKYTENMLRYMMRSKGRRYNDDEIKQKEFYGGSEKAKQVAEEEKKNSQSTIFTSMRKTTENVSSLLNLLNKEKINQLIRNANLGDKNAQAVVIAMMSAGSFVKIDKKIEEFDESQLYRFINAIENLTVAYEELGSTEALEMLEEITKRVGVELVEKDENGNKIVNRKEIRKIAKDDPYYRPRTKDELIGLTDWYEEVEDYDELIIVASNSAVQEDARKTLEDAIEKFDKGELSKEEFTKVIRELLDADFDNSIEMINATIEEFANGNRFDEEKTIIELTKSSFEYFDEMKQTGETNDNLEKQVNKLIKNACRFMVANEQMNSEIMNISLKIASKETAIAYKEAKENFEVLPIQDKMKHLTKAELGGQRNSNFTGMTSDEQKVANLTNSLKSMSDAKGIGATFRFINNGMDKASDDLRGFQEKSYYMKATLKMIEQGAEFPDSEYNKEKKKFFEKILYEQIYDEDALKQMVNMDPEIMKQILDGLIQRQNSREGDQMDTIMDLSSQIKEMSKKTKLFSTDSVEIGKTFGSTDSMFEKTKTVATSHEDDEEPGGR